MFIFDPLWLIVVGSVVTAFTINLVKRLTEAPAAETASP